MKASEKYRNVFGEIKSLNDEVLWTSGLSNMMEHFLWDTSKVLGISKTEFAKYIVSLADEFITFDKALRWDFVENKLRVLAESSDTVDRKAKPKYSYCTPREALRRARYFSEDYLNKQFDIFMSLCSDDYLDNLYRTVGLNILGIGKWSTHGNSGLFSESAEISFMQMDNLAYNDRESFLIANELKLGGQKNKDQILKYACMWKTLENKKFIKEGCDFVLIFISDKDEDHMDLNKEIESEINYCKGSKKALSYLIEPENIQRARTIKVRWITWSNIIKFNNCYAKNLTPEKQVEQKLLMGFNECLLEKEFIQMPKE
jgi:hypothetical protein